MSANDESRAAFAKVVRDSHGWGDDASIEECVSAEAIQFITWDRSWQASRKAALEDCAKRADAYSYMSENFTALAEEIRSLK